MRKLILFSLFVAFFSASLQAFDLSTVPDIRSQPEDFVAAAQDPDPKAVMKGIPPFVVDDRTEHLLTYPCTGCHTPDMIPPNPKVRPLTMMHEEIQLVHGKGRFWCTTCHNLYQRDGLTSFKGETISFNEPYLLCGQCHQAKQKDFFFGAHGKKKGNWEGVAKLTNCTECHNPHVPKIKAAIPKSPPAVRAGLKPMKPKTKHGQVFWPSDFSHIKK